MSDAFVRLMKKLRRPELRESLIAGANDVKNFADGLFSQGDDYGAEYCVNDAEESALTAMSVRNFDLEKKFCHILNGLPGPAIVTARELADLLESYFGIYDFHKHTVDMDEAYDHFLAHVERQLIKPRLSKPFALCRISDLPPAYPHGRMWYLELGRAFERSELLGTEIDTSDLPEDAGGEEEALGPGWKSGQTVCHCGNVNLEFVDLTVGTSTREIRSPDENHLRSGVLHVRFTGIMSEAAMQHLNEPDVHRLITSIVRSAALATMDTRGTRTGVPTISLNTLNCSRDFIQFCIPKLFLPERRSGIDQRIMNAVHLLAISDYQDHEAAGLAMSMAAIEALLLKEQDNIGETLAKLIRFLLEPDPAMREHAHDKVKNLYNKRSRVLHGQRLEKEPDACMQARRLASGVLYAVWHWIRFHNRMDNDIDSLDGLIEQLQRMEFTNEPPDQGVTIPDLPGVQALWRPAN